MIVTILHNILFILHITSHIIIIQLHIAFHIIFIFHVFYKHSKNFISSYVMSTYSKEMDTEKNCMYPRVLSLYETVISVYTIMYDPNWAVVMTQMGPIISVCCSICIPNRHAYLSIYPENISRQSGLLSFFIRARDIRLFISHIHG